MSLNLVPPEQLLAQAIVGQIIKSKAGGDNAKGIAAANTAIEWGQGVQQLASGDPTVALQALTDQLQSSSLDPATLDALQKAQAFALQQLAVAGQVASFMPAFGATAKDLMTNLGAGAIAAGQIDLKAYQSASAAKVAKEVSPEDSPLTATAARS